MTVLSAFLAIVFVAVALVAIAWFAKYLSTPSRSSRSERRQLSEYEDLVDRIREIAYDHRELDSQLATVITDEIRIFHQRQKRELR